MVFSSIKPLVRSGMRFFSVAIVLYGASFLKVSFIVGSSKAFFSGTSCFGSLMGAYIGLGGSTVYYLVKFLGAFCVLGKQSLPFLVYHIPGFCGALSWGTRSGLFLVGIPVLCSAAFVLHPVGAGAWVMVLYWLVPIVLWCARKRGIWAMALSSTFIMHAVGTVLWLYTRPTTPLFWWGLLPIVAIERLLYASAMVGIYRLVEDVKKVWLHGKHILCAAQLDKASFSE